MRIVCLFALFLCCTLAAADTARPIIGILSLPLEDSFPPVANVHRVRYPSGATAIIPASYVKWIEQSGARVAVVPYNSTLDQLTQLWNGINGLLYTGGGLSLDANTTYFQAAKHLYDLTINANSNGDNFAIWGTCQGFQLLNIMASNNHSILTCNFDSENLPLPLDFTEAAPSSRLFSDSQSSVSQGVSVWQTLSSRPATMNLHHCGIFPDYFYDNPDLYNNYDMLSTNQDRTGNTFVSTMEHKKFPIFAAQWHGERPQFEWDVVEQLDKSPYTMRAMQYASDIFVREARQNNHAFPSTEEETAALIYNYSPIYTGNDPAQSFPDQLTYVWF